jgi:hypothetical protein
MSATSCPVESFRNVTVYSKSVRPAKKSRYGRSVPQSRTFTKTSGLAASKK